MFYSNPENILAGFEYFVIHGQVLHVLRKLPALGFNPHSLITFCFPAGQLPKCDYPVAAFNGLNHELESG